jgi:hypothetical protein
MERASVRPTPADITDSTQSGFRPLQPSPMNNNQRDAVPTSEKYQLVQMRLLRETVSEIEELARKLNAQNRTDAVARCIHIASLVVRAMSRGQRLQLVSEDGSRETLVIPGLAIDR